MTSPEAGSIGGAGVDGLDRRTLLAALAGTGSAAAAGCSALESEADAATSGMDDERARELATRFAPTLFFDVEEPWFPTDPRPYASERDGETVVDGFDALDGYHERFESGDPPDPSVFYHAVEYEDSPLAVVQFWLYSAFDQFTANFHWHDWEVLHVFVDLETGDPQLYVASSHSRSVPNNEFLDPDPDVVPRVLSELGSHSSTLSVNEATDRFQRVSAEDLLADVTNTVVETVEDLVGVPLAYGLPRDEGARLPFVVPEYEGAPIYEHDRLPSVTEESLIDDALAVRSLDAVLSPPTDLPARETGLTFKHAGREADADIDYELFPTAELEGIDGFVGPQLSFEFDVPQAVEDAVAGHITSTGAPWGQPRYDDPAADISAGNHRAELAERYDAIGEPGSVSAVITRVTDTVTDDDAPEDEGVTTEETTVESYALLESDPEAVPTFLGIAAVEDVPAGDHRFTVNGAGRAPHSERLTVADEEAVTPAGVGGEIPTVAREDATKLEISDAESDDDVVGTAVEDDFGGRLYESKADGEDAVYVHAGGAYTAEVRDPDDEVGAYRVNPDPGSDEGVRVDGAETGKAPLSGYVADVAEETRAAVAAVGSDDGDDDESGSGGGSGGGSDGDDGGSDDGGSTNAIQGLEQALAAVVEAAERAERRAEEGDRGGTDQQLSAVRDRLERVTERIAAASDDLPPGLSNAAERRATQADRRAEQAQNSEKL